MAKGRTVFRLESEAGSLVRGYNRAIQETDRLEKGFHRAARGGRAAETSLGRLHGVVGKLSGAMGGLSVAAVGAAFIREMERMGSAVVRFDGEITPLLSLGENMQFAAQIREEVLGASSAWGLATEQIAALRFTIQSGASSLSEDTRKSIETAALQFHKLFGATPDQAARALFKTKLIFDKDVRTISNQLAFLADRGELTFEQMAALLPDVLPAAKTFGFTLEDIVAALTVATQVGGKTEKTFTGVRNVFLRMSNAQKAGIDLTGDFIAQLEKLGHVGPEALKRVFGDEAVSTIASLTQMRDLVASTREELLKLGGTDVLGAKGAERLKFDRANLEAETMRTVKQLRENEDIVREDVYGIRPVQYELSKQGARRTLPYWARWMAPAIGTIYTLGERFLGSPNPYAAAGAFDVVEGQRRGGRNDMADALLEKSVPQAEAVNRQTATLERIERILDIGLLRPQAGTPSTPGGRAGDAEAFLDWIRLNLGFGSRPSLSRTLGVDVNAHTY